MTDLTLSERLRVAISLNSALVLDREGSLAVMRMLEERETVRDALETANVALADCRALQAEMGRRVEGALLSCGIIAASVIGMSWLLAGLIQ